MIISERTLKRLGQIITGDKNLSPYRSGPMLVSFFNDFGLNNSYGQGFPSRWMFAEDCLRQFNRTPTMRRIIVAAFDPRDFMDSEKYDVGHAIKYLNDFLAFDGYEVVPYGKGYDVIDKKRGEILLDVKLEPTHLSHAYIIEQIEKCRTKTAQEDFDGAITNARTLVEAVLKAIEKETDPRPPDYDGDLPKLYKRVQKHLNLAPDDPRLSTSMKQMLSGLSNVIFGIAGLSNAMGDRHAADFRPTASHAALIVNAAMTFCNYIFDVYAGSRTNRLGEPS